MKRKVFLMGESGKRLKLFDTIKWHQNVYSGVKFTKHRKYKWIK